MRYLVTGGAGFIGSNFIRFLFNKYGDDAQVVNLDKLTYAGLRENLAEYEGKKNYRFIQGDIAKPEDVAEAYKGIDGRGVDVVVNFAAETHVDRSLMEAGTFIETDVHGVLVLLEEARKHAPNLKRFIQISTDEVYGSIEKGSFTETDPLNPRNPYSASKAGGDRMAYAYAQTYGLPVIVTRASNNFGPFQYPEKLIPLFVTNAIDDQPLPLYGDGRNIRDWLFVDDHCAAVDFLIEHGENSEVYNIGSPGGPTIITTVLQVILNVIDFDMSIQAAIDAPRFHHQWMPDHIYWEHLGVNPDVRAGLIRLGHQFRPIPGNSNSPGNIGDAHGIMIDAVTGMRMGASDPRLGGAAIGW